MRESTWNPHGLDSALLRYYKSDIYRSNYVSSRSNCYYYSTWLRLEYLALLA